MELYQLQTFVKVARTGNLTDAALQLNISQPAANAHIKALEKITGFPLFYRNPKGMTLTERGTKLLEEAQRILFSIDDFYKKAQELRQDSVETIRIGLNTDGSLLQMDKIIRQMSERLPEVEPHFVNTRSEDFLQDVAALKINAGFYYGTMTDPQIHSVMLHSCPMVVVYPNSWDVPGEELDLKAFEEKSWIWTTQGCPFHQQAMDYFLERDMVPKTIVYVDNETLIGNLVQQEMGCSLLAEPIAMQFVKENKLKVWKGIDLSVDLNFGFPKDRKRDPVMNEIVSLLQEIWKS